MFVFVAHPSVLNFNISKAQRLKNLTKFLQAPGPLKTGHLVTGAVFHKMSNTLNFSSDKRLSSQFLISDGLSQKGPASIFNLMPLLPPQQTPNKQYLGIIVSKFVMEGSGLIHKQYSVPASTDVIQRKGNDKVKCLTYCAAGAKMGYFCLQSSIISQ